MSHRYIKICFGFRFITITMYVYRSIIVLICLLTLKSVKSQTNKGDPCVIRDGRNGRCEPIFTCINAASGDLRRFGHPTYCNFFAKGGSLVCCDNEIIRGIQVTAVPNNIPGESCQVPNLPLHGTYQLEEENYFSAQFPKRVRHSEGVSVLCHKNYTTDPTKPKNSRCVHGKWSPPLNTCFHLCPGLKSSKTTKIVCQYNNVRLENCDNPIEGTIAEISCAPFEELDPRTSPTRVCRDGSWDNEVPQCVPKCGQRRSIGSPNNHPNIINGRNAAKGDYPWQVGVYSSEKKFLCGGSILNRKVILSAAHCFYDPNRGQVISKENRLIAAGKYYRSYDDPRDMNAQYATIDFIHIPERYKDSITNYELDIAVIILTKPFDLSESVQPVCMDLANEFETEQLMENTHGIVTGWGYTREGEALSEELKELSVPYISYNRCYAEVPADYRRYITYDKICAGYLENGTAVCGGDSGGALVFAKRSNGLYFIRGIISTSPGTNGICNSNQYGSYTLVSKHLEFIKNILTKNF